MKKAIFLIFFLFAVNLQSQSPEYINKMLEFFKVSGSYDGVESSIYQIIEEYKSYYADVPDEFWAEHIENFKDKYLRDFAEKLAPIYNKYLTLEDIDNAIKFYKSESGKKFSQLTNQLMEDSAVAGEAWGNFISETINNELYNEGYVE